MSAPTGAHLVAVHRVLDREPVDDLDRYLRIGGARALHDSRDAGRALLDEVAAAGLRGRGGAGFPTARKWAAAIAAGPPAAFVVNAAEGEPGSFKDRALLRRNPYRVIEGALLAARAVGTDRVVIATKASFGPERRRLEQAAYEVEAAGWLDGFNFRLALGPDAYLFGEETALLEVLEGRQPFPRVVPPYRRGLDDGSATGLARPGERDDDDWGDQPPAVVDNVETVANLPLIAAQGADWFRRLGTDASPGTIVCTVTGHTRCHGVAEVEMGMPFAAVVELIGEGPEAGHRFQAALCGVSNPFLPADRFDTLVTYEDLAAAGSGLGDAGFVLYDDRADLWAVAAAASRFLAVESCGQCEPCKRDGLAIAVELAGAGDELAAVDDPAERRAWLEDRLRTVDQGARCSLAGQQRLVVGSMLTLTAGPATTAPEEQVMPLLDIVDGRAVYDTAHLARQPDWTDDPTDSGQWPAARLEDAPPLAPPPTHPNGDPAGSTGARTDSGLT